MEQPGKKWGWSRGRNPFPASFKGLYCDIISVELNSPPRKDSGIYLCKVEFTFSIDQVNRYQVPRGTYKPGLKVLLRLEGSSLILTIHITKWLLSYVN